jgi:spermidine synthase
MGRTKTPDGTELVLAERAGEWVVRAGGHVLMSSKVHGSEEALAALALKRMGKSSRPRTLLLGGVGMGFTLRAMLDRLPVDARVVVAELVPELVAWNRGPLTKLAGRPLDDPRTRLQIGDVRGRIAEASEAFDAILLDVDNGPSALAQRGNAGLYNESGIRACRRALRPGGVLAVWSAGPDERYRERLDRAGLSPEVHEVAATGQGGRRHVIFVGTREGRRH